MSGSRNENTFFSSTVNDAVFFYKKRLRPQACFDGNRRFAAALSRRYGGFKAAGVPRYSRLVNRVSTGKISPFLGNKERNFRV